MKIVLLEGIGISDHVIEQYSRKLEAMEHSLSPLN